MLCVMLYEPLWPFSEICHLLLHLPQPPDPVPCLPQSMRDPSWGFLYGVKTHQGHTALSPTQKNVYSQIFQAV